MLILLALPAVIFQNTGTLSKAVIILKWSIVFHFYGLLIKIAGKITEMVNSPDPCQT